MDYKWYIKLTWPLAFWPKTKLTTRIFFKFIQDLKWKKIREQYRKRKSDLDLDIWWIPSDKRITRVLLIRGWLWTISFDHKKQIARMILTLSVFACWLLWLNLIPFLKVRMSFSFRYSLPWPSVLWPWPFLLL